MQYWINEQGQILTVTDVTKVVGSVYYRKRVKQDRYVVSYGNMPSQLRISLTFDTMSGVRYWMRKFGFKQKEKK